MTEEQLKKRMKDLHISALDYDEANDTWRLRGNYIITGEYFGIDNVWDALTGTSTDVDLFCDHYQVKESDLPEIKRIWSSNQDGSSYNNGYDWKCQAVLSTGRICGESAPQPHSIDQVKYLIEESKKPHYCHKHTDRYELGGVAKEVVQSERLKKRLEKLLYAIPREDVKKIIADSGVLLEGDENEPKSSDS